MIDSYCSLKRYRDQERQKIGCEQSGMNDSHCPSWRSLKVTAQSNLLKPTQLTPPMTIVIFSDVQGNFKALEEMVEKAQTFNPTEYYCLGDLVQDGNSYQDNRCVELARKLDAHLVKGNHEEELLMNPEALKKISIYHQEYLSKCPDSANITPDISCTHTLGENGFNRRIRSRSDITVEDFEKIREASAFAQFIGHSHTAFVAYQNGKIGFLSLDELPVKGIKMSREHTYLLNPGTSGGYGQTHSFMVLDIENLSVRLVRC